MTSPALTSRELDPPRLAEVEPASPLTGGQTADHASSWILVRLRDPLEGRVADGTYPLRTGRRLLDDLLAASGVHRITDALLVSMRAPADPEALARYGLDRTYKFHVPEGSDILELVERFNRLQDVAVAEPDWIARADSTHPNDVLFSDQWYFEQASDCDMDGPEAWDHSTGQVVIAMLDTGVDMTHEDLDDKLVAGYDFVNDDADPSDDNGHGTGTASTATAESDNSVGISGACWHCQIMPVKVFDDTGSGPSSVVADGIVWATDQGIEIINISGSYPSGSQTLYSSVRYAYDRGVVISSSAGTRPTGTGDRWPASYWEVLAVGGTNRQDEWANGYVCNSLYGANYGWHLDVVAPADEIYVAEMGGGYYDCAYGTSYSTPLVSGLMGLLHSYHPALSVEQARHLVNSGADDQVGNPAYDTPGFDVYHGWGRVNMHRTLDAAESSMSLRVTGKTATRPHFETPNPVAQSYDFLRGNVANLTTDELGVDLGSVVCLEDDSPDADTLGNEDTETPGPGEAFFYVARFNAAGTGSYGGSTTRLERWGRSDATPPAWETGVEQYDARLNRTYTAGDVNGDGYDDVIVSALFFDGDLTNEGLAQVYHGSATGLASTPAWSMEGDQAGASFGSSVSTAGDVDGDGYDDIIVGARKYDIDADGTADGRAFLYHGSATGLETTASWTADSDQAQARFGHMVRSAGDVNADGYDDVIIGTRWYDATSGPGANRPDRGKADVFLGSSSGLEATPSWTYVGDQANAEVGIAVGSAGDVNCDGYDDVVVGGHLYDNGQTDEGIVYVFYGSSGGPSNSPDVTLEIDVAVAHFGRRASSAGDVNGDGCDDLMVAAQLYSNGQDEEGAAFVYLGSSGGLQTTYAWHYESDQVWAEIAGADGVGDVNNDGYDDVVLASWYYDSSLRDAGRLLLFEGSSSGLAKSPSWTYYGKRAGDRLGWQVSPAGDVNNDGFDDVTMAHGASRAYWLSGRAVVFHGPLTETPESSCDP